DKTGYSKIKFCGEQAAQDGLDHFWIDSCCINRSSSPELSEAIISMFRWYGRAAKCYVYLSDVSVIQNGVQQPQEKWEAAFRASRWFTRGWTLQELLAPKLVEFYSCEGKRLGDGESLKLQIQEITRIDVQALQGVPLSRFDIKDRIGWASRRATKLEEDEACCLIGILGVSMGPLYGEGREGALSRLHNKVTRATNSKCHICLRLSSPICGRMSWITCAHAEAIRWYLLASNYLRYGLLWN
ncbi:HET-domain-containing protein, partial [Viridothelium virens]